MRKKLWAIAPLALLLTSVAVNAYFYSVNAGLQGQINSLRADNDSLQSQLDMLQQGIENLQNQLSALQSGISVFQENLTNAQNQLAVLQERISNLTELIAELEDRVNAMTATEVEVTQYPFKLTMTLNKTEFTLGETVSITLRLEYIGNKTITLSFIDGRDSFNYRVYNETGIVYDTYGDIGYPQVWIPEEVEPGWTRIWSSSWCQTGKLIYEPGGSPPAYYEKVPPGTYRIVGYFVSGTLRLTVETPPITITITE